MASGDGHKRYLSRATVSSTIFLVAALVDIYRGVTPTPQTTETTFVPTLEIITQVITDTISGITSTITGTITCPAGVTCTGSVTPTTTVLGGTTTVSTVTSTITSSIASMITSTTGASPLDPILGIIIIIALVTSVMFWILWYRSKKVSDSPDGSISGITHTLFRGLRILRLK